MTMDEQRPLTMLCLASYEKGHEFLREAKRQGCHVILLTVERLSDADWPHESIDEIYMMPRLTDRQATINAVSYLARNHEIDRIVALDDYDVETAATLREHLRTPGMGDSTARYFRDKLAMRVQALDKGILVPRFVHVLNHSHINAFTDEIPPPWILKPRSEAASMGIRKIDDTDQLWEKIDALGDRQSYYVLEQFVPGDVYHVDSIVFGREVLFSEAHKYRKPPFEVAHGGDISSTRTLPRDSLDVQALLSLNREVLAALNYVRGVSHMEFIKGHEDGRLYFLETAARVGGAFTVETIEAATGINMWAEWARLEIAGQSGTYSVPQTRQDYAGIMVALARQEWPDMSAFNDPEIVWTLKKRHHVGIIVRAETPGRVEELLDAYIPRLREEYLATQPVPDTAPE
jgi:biotin carboxylase